MKIKRIIFDGDGTLWHYPTSAFGSSWDALSHALGVEKECASLLKEYYHQKGKDYEWTMKQVELFRGGKIEDIEKKIYPTPYNKNVVEFFRNNKRFSSGLLTTALDVVAAAASDELGMDFCHCNVLGKVQGRLTGEIEYHVPLWGKHKLIEKCFNGFKSEECAYVGDSKNDVNCMGKVGLSIAFNPKDAETREAADFVIYDFKELEGIINEHK